MSLPPLPPPPPPCRIEHRGLDGGFFGPEDEFREWQKEPLWRRILGFTAYDRRMRADRGQHAVRPGN